MIADNDIYIYIYIINTVFEIQALSTSEIKCRGKFRIFQFASALLGKNIYVKKTFVYHVGKMKNENEKKLFFKNIQQGMTQKTTKR